MTIELWDPWDQLCTCGHQLHEHICDWGRPDEGVTPDCRYLDCKCMDFEPQR